MQMEINITYRADSRVEAHRFRTDILQRFAEGRNDYFHELDYHYTIPYDQMQLLKDIHTLRESNAGYGEDFETWVNNHISPRATNIATQIATQKKVAIREKQISPMGFFDFVGTVEPAQKDREGATMNTTFQYTLTYDQVQACVIVYPLTVHGQLIPDRYYAKPNPSGYYSQDGQWVDNHTCLYLIIRQRILEGGIHRRTFTILLRRFYGPNEVKEPHW
jgi:hypothetical protein